MTEPGYQGNKAGTLTVTPAPSLHPYLLWKGHRAGPCKDEAGNKISDRQIQNFSLSVPALVKTRLADALCPLALCRISAIRVGICIVV